MVSQESKPLKVLIIGAGIGGLAAAAGLSNQGHVVEVSTSCSEIELNADCSDKIFEKSLLNREVCVQSNNELQISAILMFCELGWCRHLSST